MLEVSRGPGFFVKGGKGTLEQDRDHQYFSV